MFMYYTYYLAFLACILYKQVPYFIMIIHAKSTSIGSLFISSECNLFCSSLSKWVHRFILPVWEYQSFNYNKCTDNQFTLSSCQIPYTRDVIQKKYYLLKIKSVVA